MPGPRRPGLVAKKISVLGKRGRRHQQTYWLRPGIAQVVRLRRAQKEGEQARATRATVEHPRVSVMAFFKGRGYPMSEELADKLINFFKKPDGTSMTGDDFDRMFKNPGKKEMPVLRETGGMETWGRPKTEIVHGADGKPLTQHMDVQIGFDSIRVAGGEVSFDMRVMGQKFHPPGHTQAGEPDGGHDWRMDEGFERYFSRPTALSEFGGVRPTGIVAEHALFFLYPQYSGGGVRKGEQGLGMEIISNQIATYASVGVSDVTVHAACMGKYAWGRMGFEASPRSIESLHDNFKNMITGIQAGPHALHKAAGEKYTVAELRAAHDINTYGTQAVYKAEVPVYNAATGKMENKQVWKDMVLGTPPFNGYSYGLSGHIKVEDGDPNYEAAREYLKIKAPRTTTAQAAEAPTIIRAAAPTRLPTAAPRTIDAPETAASATAATRQRAPAQSAEERSRVVQAALGARPWEMPSERSLEGRRLTQLMRQYRDMSPAQREAHVRGDGDPHSNAFRVERQRALDELTGVAAKARAEYATREAAHLRSMGNGPAAAGAARRAVNETRASEAAATALATHESTTVRARAAAQLVNADEAVARARTAYEAAKARSQQKEGEPSLFHRRTAAAVLAREEDRYRQAQETAQLLRSPHASTEVLRTVLEEKAGRATARAAAEEVARQPEYDAVRARAQAVLPRAQREAREAAAEFQRVQEARRAAGPSISIYSPDAESRAVAREHESALNRARTRDEQARNELDHVEGLSRTGGQGYSDRGRFAVSRLGAVEQREATRQATRAAEVSADAVRAKVLLPKAEAKLQQHQEEVTRLEKEHKTAAGADLEVVTRRLAEAKEKVRVADDDVFALQRLVTEPSREGRGNEGIRQDVRGTMAAKEGRIAARVEAERQADVVRAQQEVAAEAKRVEKERAAAEEEAARAAKKAEKKRQEADQVARLAEVRRAAAVEAARTAPLGAMRTRTGTGRRSQLLRRL